MRFIRKIVLYQKNGKKTTKSLFYSVIIFTLITCSLFNFSLVSSLLTTSIIIHNTGKIGGISPLHVEGRYIKDLSDNIVILKGINQAGYTDSANGWWNPQGGGSGDGWGVWEPEAVQYNLDQMVLWGCNVIRLHTMIDWWIKDTSNYRQHIKDTVQWAGDRGIYVIFEPYSILDGEQEELPWAPYGNTAAENAIIPDSQAYLDYYLTVVNELNQYDNVIYETYNEPHGTEAQKDEYFMVVQQWIDMIRATGSEHVLIIQWGHGIWCNLDFPPPTPPTLNSAPGSSGTLEWIITHPMFDPEGNLVYSFHHYRNNFHRTIPGYFEVYEYNDIMKALEYCWVDYAVNSLNVPVVCGEIGANMWSTGSAFTEELTYYENMLIRFNELGIGYLGWVWTVPSHMMHGLLQNDRAWCPPPNEAGEILIAKIEDE